MPDTELEIIVDKVIDYIRNVCDASWQPDKTIIGTLPPNIPTVDRLCWIRLTEGFTFNFINTTPVSDECTIPISITLHFRKEEGQTVEEQLMSNCAIFNQNFYSSVHPGGVSYLPQIDSLTGNEIDEKTDYAEINANVSMRSLVTRMINDRSVDLSSSLSKFVQNTPVGGGVTPGG